MDYRRAPVLNEAGFADQEDKQQLDHDVGGARDLKFFRPSRQRIPDELDGGESDGADVGLLEAAGPPRVSGSESTLPVLYQGDFRIGCI